MNEQFNKSLQALNAASDGIGQADDAEIDEEADEIGEYRPVGGIAAQDEPEKKNPYNNPKNHIITAALLIGMMLVLIFSDSIKQTMQQRDAEQNELISIIALSDDTIWDEGGELIYYTLAGGKRYDVEPFEADGAQRFVHRETFRHDDERMNYLDDKRVYPDGNMDGHRDSDVPEEDPLFERILDLVEQTETEHWIFYARILRVQGEYFVCVDRNVNLWTPYVLYYYSPQKDALYHLTTLSDMNVMDIRLGENFREKIYRLMDRK